MEIVILLLMAFCWIWSGSFMFVKMCQWRNLPLETNSDFIAVCVFGLFGFGVFPIFLCEFLFGPRQKQSWFKRPSPFLRKTR